MKTKAPFNDKREYVRLASPYRVTAKELTFPAPKEHLIDSICYDISKGGVCVYSNTCLPVGTRLQVSVHIPLLNKYSSTFFKVYENDAEQYFHAIGDVAWTTPEGKQHLTGINFVNADKNLTTALGKLVNDVLASAQRKQGKK